MRQNLLASLAAFVFAVMPASAETSLVDLMKAASKDFRETERQKLVEPAVLKSMILKMLTQHAQQYMMKPAQQAEVAELATAGRLVLPDGQMASTAYHDTIKMYFAGPGALQMWIGAYARENPQSSFAKLLVISNRLSIAAEPWRVAFVRPQPVDDFAPELAKLEEVRKLLLDNKDMAKHEPYWYSLMAEVMTFQHADEADVRALVEEGLKAFPEHVELPVLASNRFLDRWGGDGAKLEDFAQWVMTLPAAAARPDIYARMYWNAIANEYQLTMFKNGKKNWKLMAPALDKLTGSYATLPNLNIAAMISCLGGDRDRTRNIIMREDFKPASAFWQDRDAFFLCSGWAG